MPLNRSPLIFVLPLVGLLCLSAGVAGAQSEAAECKAGGGTMAPISLTGQRGCILPTADAGKPCTSGADCEAGRCLVDEADETRGQCAPTDYAYGCFRLMRDGKADDYSICLD